MIIVTGHARTKPGGVKRLGDANRTMIAASRAEEGCLAYSYGVDLTDPDRLIVLEYWRDQAALDAHFTTPHMAEWRKAIAGEIVEIDVKAGDAGAMKALS